MTLSTIQWLRSCKASAAALAGALFLVPVCSSGASAGGPKVALLVGAESNPYFKKMAEAAKAEAAKDGVDLAVASKVGDSDEVQSSVIETAVGSGVSTILIVPGGPGVVPAIRKARAAGIMVLALDNPTTPNDAVDMAYVTSNRDAGQALGKYVAAKLAGAPAVIAMLDVFEGKVVQVDIDRDHGFLTGMGIPETNPNVNGAEPKTGKYTGGGNYTVVCHQATQGAEDGGRTAMENCLSKNPNINVVYTINEPAGFGAYKALQAAGKTQGVTVAAFDGSCRGVAALKKGMISVDVQTYPAKMAELGIRAAVAYAKNKSIPKPSPGLTYFNPGIALVTDSPVSGINSIGSDEGSKSCF
ncbi:MAG: substrate-binding domain-containing protein [Isosphaeraceae bacterium]